MSTPISPTELEARLASDSATLVEALSPDFFAAGHIPGAVNLPLSSSDGEIEAALTGHPAIVVYGTRHGGEAAELAHRIETLGFVGVMILTGGKESWAEAERPLCDSPDGSAEL